MRVACVLVAGGFCLGTSVAFAASTEEEATQQAQRRMEAIRAQCARLPTQAQATTAQEVYVRALCQQPMPGTQPPAESQRESAIAQQTPPIAPEPESLVVDASTDLSELPLGYHCHPFAFGKKICHNGPQ